MYRLKTIIDSYFESYGSSESYERLRETKQSQNITTGKEARGDSTSVVHLKLTASDRALVTVAFIELLINKQLELLLCNVIIPLLKLTVT